MTKTAITVGAVKNATNNPAYDNQPGFLRDSSAFLFSSVRDGKPHDIYRYEIASGAIKQVTSVLEGEYSPTVTPDGNTFSAIRIEEDKTTQRLWRFDLDGSNPRVIFNDLQVGYHVWVDATHLALFVLAPPEVRGDVHTFQYADTTTGKSEILEKGIGRSLHMRPGTGTVSYISKPATGVVAGQRIRSEDEEDLDDHADARQCRRLCVVVRRPTADGDGIDAENLDARRDLG